MLGEILSGVAGIGGGLLAGDARESAANRAADAQKQAVLMMIAKLDQVGMPPDQSAAVILDQFKQAGVLTPQLEEQVKSQVSEFQNIKVNQLARDTQIQALQQMKQYGKAGLTADERAQMRANQLAVQQQNEANQQAIQQQMQARGMQGSGSELAARLMASQGSANQASANADAVSSMAQQRALQALMSQSNMAGQLAQQQFGEDSARAAAADEMNRFNVQNQMAIGQRNVAAGNQAQAANLSNLQSINNANVAMNNEEKYDQLRRQRQFWNDKLKYAQAYGGPLTQYGNAGADQAQGVGDARSKMFSTLGGALSSGIAGAFTPAAPAQVFAPQVAHNEEEVSQQRAQSTRDKKALGII